MKFLVTGCLGYIGSRLTGELLSLPDATVMGVDTLMYNQELVLGQFLGHPRFRFEVVDVRDYYTMAHFVHSADVVIPLAALVGAPLCVKAHTMATEVNEDSIRWLVHQLSTHQRIIFPQTNSGYGSTGKVCTEESPLTPLSLYARTKTKAERVVLQHPNAVSLRLATVFGCSPRMRLDLLVNDFTDRLAHQEALTLYEPHAQRNYVHVRDVANALVFFSMNSKHTGVYNLGDPHAQLSKLGLAELACDILGLAKESHIHLGEGFDQDRRDYVVSNDKVLQTGFEFQHGICDGIREVAHFVRYLTPPARKRLRNT